MARITKPLTDKEIKLSKSGSKIKTLHDGYGLDLVISKKGCKSWVFRYPHPYTKIRQKMTIGRYPAVSLLDARNFRTEAKTLLAKKIDPKENSAKLFQTEIDKINNTLLKVTENFLEIKRSECTDKYINDIRNSFKLHIYPKIGNFPITEITRSILITLLKPLEKEGKHETVKRLIQRLGEVIDYSINNGYIEISPTHNLYKAFKKPKKEHMLTIHPSELKKFLNILDCSSVTYETKNLIVLQLLTATRPAEAANASWDEIDLENKQWIIPAERMKKRKMHIIPLCKNTLIILEKMKQLSANSVYIFPSISDKTKPINSQTANAAIKRIGYKGKLVAHGLRSIASTAMNEADKFNPDVIEAALSHSDKNSVRAAYNRSTYLESRIELMEWWGNFVFDAAKESSIFQSIINT